MKNGTENKYSGKRDRWLRERLAGDAAKGRKESKGIIVDILLEENEDDEMYAEMVAGLCNPDAEEDGEVEGFRFVSGEVEFKSGERFYAFLYLCVKDSCEHYNTIFLLPTLDGDYEPFEQGTEAMKKQMEIMNRVKPEIAKESGYRYMYYDESLRERDHHVGEDGWSR